MFFKQGEFFEANGSAKFMVFYADEEKALLLRLCEMPGGRVITGGRNVFVSNKETDYEDAYWLKKLDNVEINQFCLETLKVYLTRV